MSTKAQRLRGRLSIDPDAVPGPALAPTASPSARTEPSSTATGTPEVEQDHAPDPVPGNQSVPQPRPAGAPSVAQWRTALDDPAILPGRNGYRSFYVSDPIFARFRAAIHWTSRRPDAAGRVPENMSAAVEEFMDRLASELEADFNGGEVFPPTPEQRRRRRTSS